MFGVRSAIARMKGCQSCEEIERDEQTKSGEGDSRERCLVVRSEFVEAGFFVPDELGRVAFFGVDVGHTDNGEQAEAYSANGQHH